MARRSKSVSGDLFSFLPTSISPRVVLQTLFVLEEKAHASTPFEEQGERISLGRSPISSFLKLIVHFHCGQHWCEVSTFLVPFLSVQLSIMCGSQIGKPLFLRKWPGK